MSREGPHVLFCAFAEVPGPTAAGVRTCQMMRAFGGGFDVDGLCLKGPEVAHIERLGSARVMRVPVDNKPFLERLAAYRRALGRQLAGDHYDVVWCADLFSGAVAASYKEAQGFSLVVDVGGFPSESFARLYDVDPTDKKLRAEWSAGEKAALRSARVVLAPSRTGAKALVGRVDASKVQVLPRAVDREVFTPPTMELALDAGRTVLVVGGREGGPLLEPAVRLLQALHDATDSDEVQLAFAGSPPPSGDRARAALAEAGLAGRVKLVDTEGAAAVAAALADAHVVVVPSTAEAGIDPLAAPHRALEAMACRRPTVLTGPAVAFADTLVPGEDALVTPAGDPAAAAVAVSKLLDSPALREAVAQSGARRVEQEADLATRLGQVAALLSDLLGDVLSAALPPRAAESTSPVDDLRASDSSVFTDEGPPSIRAPRAPTAPSAVDVGATSLEAPLDDGPALDPLPGDKTLIAPPPAGLEDLLATPGEDGGADDWYGDTRIDPGRGFPQETPTPLEERARTTTRRQVTPEPPTSTGPPGARAFTAEPEPVSLPEGDPWGHDTIADARPVFTSDDGSRKTPLPARAPAEPSGRSFLVDPELLDASNEVSPLEDATVDEMQLPRETSSSDG